MKVFDPNHLDVIRPNNPDKPGPADSSSSAADAPTTQEEHPHMVQVAVMARFLSKWARSSEVLGPLADHCGSGSSDSRAVSAQISVDPLKTGPEAQLQRQAAAAATSTVSGDSAERGKASLGSTGAASSRSGGGSAHESVTTKPHPASHLQAAPPSPAAS